MDLRGLLLREGRDEGRKGRAREREKGGKRRMDLLLRREEGRKERGGLDPQI